MAAYASVAHLSGVRELQTGCFLAFKICLVLSSDVWGPLFAYVLGREFFHNSHDCQSPNMGIRPSMGVKPNMGVRPNMGAKLAKLGWLKPDRFTRKTW